jgi:thymidylate kinase
MNSGTPRATDQDRDAGRWTGRTIALVGSDGAGKSTVARAVVRLLPYDAGYLYMGVNLEASPVMLPTTRLVLALKRLRGRRADMTLAPPEPSRSPGPFTTTRRLVRMTNWLAEEAYRAVLARRMQRRGMVVVFDRHFYCDYYASAVAPSDRPRPLDVRIHGYVLRHWYPRPDLTLLLDAPAELLVARKAEGTLEGAARRRQEYLALAGILPAFEVLAADRPLEAVIQDVADRIISFVEAGAVEAPVGPVGPAGTAGAPTGAEYHAAADAGIASSAGTDRGTDVQTSTAGA